MSVHCLHHTAAAINSENLSATVECLLLLHVGKKQKAQSGELYQPRRVADCRTDTVVHSNVTTLAQKGPSSKV